MANYCTCLVNPFQPCVAFHTETSHLVRRGEQMTGFYMKRDTRLKWVNPLHNTSPFLHQKSDLGLISFAYSRKCHKNQTFEMASHLDRQLRVQS